VASPRRPNDWKLVQATAGTPATFLASGRDERSAMSHAWFLVMRSNWRNAKPLLFWPASWLPTRSRWGRRQSLATQALAASDIHARACNSVKVKRGGGATGRGRHLCFPGVQPGISATRQIPLHRRLVLVVALRRSTEPSDVAERRPLPLRQIRPSLWDVPLELDCEGSEVILGQWKRALHGRTGSTSPW
jgi:hypothetical protein